MAADHPDSLPSILSQLEALAYKLGVDVRYEDFEEDIENSLGGLLKLKGRHVILVNREKPLKAQVKTLIKALRKFNIQGLYVKPALRELLSSSRPRL